MIQKLKYKFYVGKPFQYLYPLAELILAGKKLPFNIIKEGGGRKPGKTEAFCRLFWYLFLTDPKQTYSVHIFRKEIQNVKETWDTFLAAVPPELLKHFKINHTYHTVIGKRFYLRVIGLLESSKTRKKKIQKVGMRRVSADWTIIFKEESAEFNKKDYNSILSAVKLSKNSLILHASNPYNPHAPYWKDFNQYLPFNMEKMKTIGEDYKIIPEKKMLLHWTNIISVWNEWYLSEADKNSLMTIAEDDPFFGETSYYGKPTSLEGAILTSKTLSKINWIDIDEVPPLFNNKHTTLWAGLDFGYSTDPTALLIGLKREDTNDIFVMYEMIIDNQKQTYDNKVVANQIISFIYKYIEPIKGSLSLSVVCDDDFSLVHYLNNAIPKGNNWLQFIRISSREKGKKRIYERCKEVVSLVSEGKIWLHKSIKYLPQEWETWQWKKNQQDLRMNERIALNGDHFSDAFEYGAL